MSISRMYQRRRTRRFVYPVWLPLHRTHSCAIFGMCPTFDPKRLPALWSLTHDESKTRNRAFTALVDQFSQYHMLRSRDGLRAHRKASLKNPNRRGPKRKNVKPPLPATLTLESLRPAFLLLLRLISDQFLIGEGASQQFVSQQIKPVRINHVLPVVVPKLLFVKISEQVKCSTLTFGSAQRTLQQTPEFSSPLV